MIISHLLSMIWSHCSLRVTTEILNECQIFFNGMKVLHAKLHPVLYIVHEVCRVSYELHALLCWCIIKMQKYIQYDLFMMFVCVFSTERLVWKGRMERRHQTVINYTRSKQGYAKDCSLDCWKIETGQLRVSKSPLSSSHITKTWVWLERFMKAICISRGCDFGWMNHGCTLTEVKLNNPSFPRKLITQKIMNK